MHWFRLRQFAQLWGHPEQIVPFKNIPNGQLVHWEGFEVRQVEQLELEVHAVHVWLNLVRSLLTWRENPEGQTMQFAFWLQLVSGTQILPSSKYPWRHEVHEVGSLTEQVAQGVRHAFWHLKFWLRKYPETQIWQPIELQEMQFWGQVETVAQTLFRSS